MEMIETIDKKFLLSTDEVKIILVNYFRVKYNILIDTRDILAFYPRPEENDYVLQIKHTIESSQF